jgi:cation:H+ antiporter
MELWAAVAVLAVGLFVLDRGAGWLVEGSSALATLARVSPLVIGLTIVAYGTSLPELAASSMASLKGDSGISIGNVVGSNIANLLLILGAAAVVRPINVSRQVVTRESVIMVGAAVLVLALATFGEIGRAAGVVLLVAFAAYIGYFVRDALRGAREYVGGSPVQARFTRGVSVVLVGGGLASVLLGALLMVEGAISVAHRTGVPSSIIGLTIVAVGTSLPELATSLKAAHRGEGDIAIGNVVGSNVFNSLLVLGVAAVIYPLSVDGGLLLDMAIMVLVSVAVIPLFWTGLRLSRREGVAMLAAYVFYILYLAMR